MRSDIAVISYSSTDRTHKYVFFESSGENSYGASVSSIACFVDGQYFCDYDDIPSDSELKKLSDDEIRQYLGVKLALATWNVYEEDSKKHDGNVVESYGINGNKVAKKLKIKASID